MSQRSWLPLVALLVLTFPTRGQAQGSRCQQDDTVAQCWERLAGAVRTRHEQLAEDSNSVKELEDAERTDLQEKSSGTPGFEGLSSAIADYLPIFATSLGFSQTDAEDGAVAFESNRPVSVGTATLKFKLRAVLHDASLDPELAESLPAATAETRRTALEEELGDFDDVSLSIGSNVQGRRFGRSFEEHSPLYSGLFSSAVRSADPEAEFVLREAEALHFLSSDLADSTDRACADLLDEPSELPLTCLSEARRLRFELDLVGIGEVERAADRKLDAALASTGFFLFADMINNQPQLSFEVRTRLRHDLVGPDEYGFSARYELGLVNVNSYRGHAARECSAPEAEGADRAAEIGCLSGYLQRPGVEGALKRADRFIAEANLRYLSAYELNRPADTVSIARDAAWELTGSLGYGRYLAVAKDGTETGRFDFTAEYHHPMEDPARQSRLVASLAYSQRLPAGLTLAVGFSYANRPEFLGDVDQKVTANFGLRYKILQE